MEPMAKMSAPSHTEELHMPQDLPPFPLELGEPYRIFIDAPEVEGDALLYARGALKRGIDAAIFKVSDGEPLSAFLATLGGIDPNIIVGTARYEPSVWKLLSYQGKSPLTLFGVHNGTPLDVPLSSESLDRLGAGSISRL